MRRKQTLHYGNCCGSFRAGVGEERRPHCAPLGRGDGLRDQACASSAAPPPSMRRPSPRAGPQNPGWGWRDGTGTAGPGCSGAQSLRLPAKSKGAAAGSGSGVQSSACFCNCFDDAFECSHHYRDATALLMTTIY